MQAADKSPREGEALLPTCLSTATLRGDRRVPGSKKRPRFNTSSCVVPRLQREPGDWGWGWLPGSCADDERQAAVQWLSSPKPWPSTQHLIPQEWVGVTLRWTAALNFPLRNGPTGSAGQDVSLNTLISKEMSEDICFRNGNNTRR